MNPKPIKIPLTFAFPKFRKNVIRKWNLKRQDAPKRNSNVKLLLDLLQVSNSFNTTQTPNFKALLMALRRASATSSLQALARRKSRTKKKRSLA
jgi:hypothetical protein